MKFHPFQINFRLHLTILALVTMSFLTVACGPSTAESTRQVTINDVQVTVSPPTAVPYVFKTSEPGSITIHGDLIVLNPMSTIPAPNDSIFLVPIPTDQPLSMIPQFEVGTVPQAEVDESEGEFYFTNIQPGQYAVVVITMGKAQVPVRYLESESFAIFTLDESQKDTTFELGQLTLP